MTLKGQQQQQIEMSFTLGKAERKLDIHQQVYVMNWAMKPLIALIDLFMHEHRKLVKSHKQSHIMELTQNLNIHTHGVLEIEYNEITLSQKIQLEFDLKKKVVSYRRQRRALGDIFTYTVVMDMPSYINYMTKNIHDAYEYQGYNPVILDNHGLVLRAYENIMQDPDEMLENEYEDTRDLDDLEREAILKYGDHEDDYDPNS